MSLLQKLLHDSSMQKTAARVFLIVATIASLAWLVPTLLSGKKISTDVLDLIPQNERSPELAVVRSLANEKQARVALFALTLSNLDETKRDAAARAFTDTLLASKAFTEAEITGDTASRNALGKQIYDQRYDLLLPGWLAKHYADKSATTASVTEQAASELETFMAKPEALAFNEILGSDPLLLLPTLVEKVQALDPSSQNSEISNSKSQINDNTVLIWSLTKDKPLDPAGQKPVFDAVNTALAAARNIAPDATLRWTAISRFAAASREHITYELIFGNILSFIAVLGVAAICLPSILKALKLAPVIFGAMLGACVAVTLCFERVHFLVFVLGLMLAGVAIDYGFYLYLQPKKNPGENYTDKVRRLLKPLLGSALTTVLGFSLLLFSDLPLIRQLGVFVSAGLLSALVTAVVWFAQIKKPYLQTRAFANIQARHTPRVRRIALTVLAAVALIALVGPWRLHWHDDIRGLQVAIPELNRDATELRALFGDSPTRTIYITRGNTVAEARDALEKFNTWHTAHFPGSSMASLGQAIPLHDDWFAQPQRLAALADFETQLRAALERHGFNATEFEPFFTTLRTWASTPRDDYDAIVARLQNALRGQTALLMSAAPGSSWFVTIANHAPGGDDPPPEVATVSLNQLETLNKLFTRYRTSALRLSAIGLALVGLSMWLIYGVKRGSLIFATPIGSCLFAFGVLGLCGVTLNLFHLLGAFLGVCLSHNYAIFSAENDARHEQPPPSIRLSALSTAASFGVLSLSSIPVVSALGVTVTLIVITALAIVELRRAANPHTVF